MSITKRLSEIYSIMKYELWVFVLPEDWANTHLGALLYTPIEYAGDNNDNIKFDNQSPAKVKDRRLHILLKNRNNKASIRTY